MGKLVVCTNVTLDGVMQAPGRPDEDTRDGFRFGGWAAPYAAMSQAGDAFANAGALLLGRRTYEDFFNVWPKQPDSPFTPWLSKTPKFVVSTTLEEPLPWENSTLIRGDVASRVAALKRQLAQDLLILGSGELVISLMQAGAVDEFVLLIHPLVLGSGRRLFAAGSPHTRLSLIKNAATPSGVVAATYRPAAAAG